MKRVGFLLVLSAVLLTYVGMPAVVCAMQTTCLPGGEACPAHGPGCGGALGSKLAPGPLLAFTMLIPLGEAQATPGPSTEYFQPPRSL